MSTSGDGKPRRGDRSGLQDEVRLGAFRYLPDQSVLLKDGKRVRIGSRAMALLRVLVDHVGQVVPNDALIAAAWPDTRVEDTNLRVQMAALRRLLTDDGERVRITNAPGRGYALTVAPGGHEDGQRPPEPARAEQPPAGLPVQLTSLVGREDAVATVAARLSDRRLVVVVGPGGIGKTRVAIEACARLIEAEGRQVCFVDLAPLSSPAFVASAVATALRIGDEAAAEPVDRIVRALRRDPGLLVLDNCEHVLDVAADLAEGLLRALPDLRILATSREPLLLDGEVTVRLAGLGGPGDAAGPPTLEEALAFPAIRLLVERAAAGADGAPFRDADVPALVEISRRLDGIPLAIELAAASIASLGVHGVAAILRDRFATLSGGRRTAPPRHRTMRATLDWSYDKLSTDERMLLVRLSVFRSMFSLAGAQAVNPLAPEATIPLLASLVQKSLVVVDHRRAVTRFRLLEATRGFAEEKLLALAEEADVRRRHAAHLAALFAAEKTGARTDPSVEPHEEFRTRVDDVRAAIGWTLSAMGDPRLGVRLITDSGPMWLSLSILGEYVAIVDGAADRLLQDPRIDSNDAMWLAPSLHLAKFHVVGFTPSMAPMLLKALELAEGEGDDACRLACLWGLLGLRITEARYADSLDYARRFADLAPRVADRTQRSVAHRVMALCSWRDGDLASARPHSEIALAPVAPNPASPLNQSFIYKQGAAARANASNLLWLGGFPDRAVAEAAEAVTLGLEHDVLGLCYALAQTVVPLSFWVGDFDQARTHTMLLIDITSDAGLGFWLNWGRSYEAALHRWAATPRTGADFIDTHAASLGDLHGQILATILGEAPGWLEGLDAPGTHWCSAELLRVAALGRLRRGKTQSAQRLLDEALALARRQGAFAWELRAATTLAELHLREGRSRTARELLVPVAERATEGFDTADLRRAAALLVRLDGG